MTYVFAGTTSLRIWGALVAASAKSGQLVLGPHRGSFQTYPTARPRNRFHPDFFHTWPIYGMFM